MKTEQFATSTQLANVDALCNTAINGIASLESKNDSAKLAFWAASGKHAKNLFDVSDEIKKDEKQLIAKVSKEPFKLHTHKGIVAYYIATGKLYGKQLYSQLTKRVNVYEGMKVMPKEVNDQFIKDVGLTALQDFATLCTYAQNEANAKRKVTEGKLRKFAKQRGTTSDRKRNTTQTIGKGDKAIVLSFKVNEGKEAEYYATTEGAMREAFNLLYQKFGIEGINATMRIAEETANAKRPAKVQAQA